MAMPGSSCRPKWGKVESRKFRELGARRDITSTAELVQAYNNATDPHEHNLLHYWLDQYIRWFSKQNELELNSNIIKSYSGLAHIQCRGSTDRDLTTRFFRSLIARLDESDDSTYDVIPALEYMLNVIDPSILKKKVKELLKLPGLLLSHLDPDENRFTKMTFVNHGLTLFTLHQTLVVLQMMAPGQLPEKVLDDIMERMREIERSAEYYPYIYLARLIKNSIKNLKEHNAFAPWISWSRRVFHGVCGSLFVMQGVTAAMRFECDFSAIESGWKHFREAFNDPNRNKWTPQLQDFMETAEKSLRENNFSHFKNQMNAVFEKGRCRPKEKHGKMIRFSVISHLHMIIVEGHSDELRNEAMEELLRVACPPSSSNSWIKEPDLFEAVLDALYDIQKRGREQSQRALDAIEVLMSINCDNKLQEKAEAWKSDVKAMEDTFASNMDQDVPPFEELFETMRTEVGLVLAWKDIENNINNLKNNYKSRHFAEVTSLFNEWTSIHVKDFEYDIVRYEEIRASRREVDDGNENHLKELAESKRRVRTRVDLKDIMKPKEVKDGEALTSKDRKYLLLGNPGVGKTSIGKSFAYGWASGTMGDDFEAVYVLPIRHLTSASLAECSRPRDLASVIAKECFSQGDYSNDDYKALREQINDDLQNVTTLLILDGLDEGDKTGLSMIRDALKCDCHLLMTSRPYNLTGIRQEVGTEMECLGLDDEQLKRFVKRRVLENTEELLKYLRNTPSIWEMAHAPVTAGILCCVWNEKQESHSSDEAMPNNRLELYDQMVHFVWKRYLRKLEESGAPIPDRDKVFEALQKIAIHARINEQILISEVLVGMFAPGGNSNGELRNAGFLLLQFEGTYYPFAHLTFQEYFAAMFLARVLLEGSLADKKMAHDFIANNKYKEVHRETLRFMMQRMTQAYGEVALYEVFGFVDQEPCDVLGIQHRILKLQLVDASLSVKETLLEIDSFNASCKGVVDAVSEIFCSLTSNYKHKVWVKDHLKQALNVLKWFPDMFSYLFEWHGEAWLSRIDHIGDLSKYTSSVWQAVEYLLKKRPENEDVKREFFMGFMDYIFTYGVPVLALTCFDAIWRDSTARIREFVCDEMVRRIGRRDDDWPEEDETDDRVLEIFTNRLSDTEVNIRLKIISFIGGRTDHWDEFYAYDSNCVYHSGLCRVLVSMLRNENGPTVFEKACKDDEEHIRAAALESLINFISELKHRASHVRQAISVGLSDPKVIVRRTVAEGLRKIASGEENEMFAWRLLLQCLEDRSPSVRVEAVNHIVTVGRTASIDDDVVWKLLMTRLTDMDVNVFIHAMEKFAQLNYWASEDLKDLMGVLANACNDDELEIREKACRLVAHIGHEAPAMSTMCLKILKNKYEDRFEKVDVRRMALKFIVDCIIDTKDELGSVVNVLLRDCDDGEVRIREETFRLIIFVCGRVPTMKQFILNILKRMCMDKDNGIDFRCTIMREMKEHFIDAMDESEGLVNFLALICDDDEVRIREVACDLTISFCQKHPAMKQTGLNILKRMCMDKNNPMYLRNRIMREIMEHFKHSMDESEGLVNFLARIYDGGELDIGAETFDVIISVFQWVPTMKQTGLNILKRMCMDKKNLLYLRNIIMSEIMKHFIDSMDESEALMNFLERLCDDDNLQISKETFDLIISFCQKHPTMKQTSLNVLKRMFAKDDISCDFRIKIMRKLTWHSIDMECMLNLLTHLCYDNDIKIRKEAFGLIISVCERDPAMKQSSLNILKRMCVDKHDGIHFRIILINKIKTHFIDATHESEELVNFLTYVWYNDGDEIRKEEGSLTSTPSQRVSAMMQTELETFVAKWKDRSENDYWSMQAMNEITDFIVATKDGSEALINAIALSYADGDIRIRERAFEWIFDICRKVPTASQTCLSILKACCEEEEHELSYTSYFHLLKLLREIDEKNASITNPRRPTERDSFTGKEIAYHSFYSPEETVGYFNWLLKKYIKKDKYDHQKALEDVIEAHPEVEELMIKAACDCLANPDDSIQRKGDSVLKIAIDRIQRIKRVPVCSLEAVGLLIKVTMTGTKSRNIWMAESLIQESIPLSHLLDYYLSSQDDDLFEVIRDRLLDIAVTFTQKDDGQRSKLVIYEASDEVEYVKSSEDVRRLVWMMKSVLPESQSQPSYILPPDETVESEHKKKKQKTKHQDSDNPQ